MEELPPVTLDGLRVSEATVRSGAVTVSVTSNPATLTVTAPLLTVASLTLSPSSVTGGSSSIGTVTLSAPAPAGGAQVTLSSNDPPVATVPSSVTVPAAATSATFTVSTNAVSTSTLATISGSYNGSTQ